MIPGLMAILTALLARWAARSGHELLRVVYSDHDKDHDLGWFAWRYIGGTSAVTAPVSRTENNRRASLTLS